MSHVGPHTPGCIAGDIDGECPCEQGDRMTVIEQYHVGRRMDTSTVYVTTDAGRVVARCDDADDAERIASALNSQGAVAQADLLASALEALLFGNIVAGKQHPEHTTILAEYRQWRDRQAKL